MIAKVAGSSPGRSGGRIFFSGVNVSVLTLISVSIPPLCYVRTHARTHARIHTHALATSF